jgi:hypothetical protein
VCIDGESLDIYSVRHSSSFRSALTARLG